MTRVKSIIITLLALFVWVPLSAQFYSNGVGPASIRWRTTEGESVRVVAPDYAEGVAHRVLFMMDSLTNTIGYGLGKDGGAVPPLSMPVVLHTENSASNGISIMAPRRIEMCAMPATDSYATPWLRQLSVHEYRHAAQYGALFGGSARWLYYLLGEQSLLALTGVMPFWWLEGDAVDAETQASLFGRALQPSFTMHYRAVGRRILEGDNPDKWFAGSYNEFVPSHYNLGYQMVTTANTLAGRYAWGEVMDYASRKWFTITPFEWAMRDIWGYSTEGLFVKTFERLNDRWDTLPTRGDSATKVAYKHPSDTPYIQTKYPLWIDSDRVVVVESTFDEPTALVEVDVRSGNRRILHHIGYLNTRPARIGDYLYWTEMEQLSTFAQQMGSVMCCARVDGRGGVRRALCEDIYALYPVEFGGELAYVRYNFEGTYSVVCKDGEMTLPEGMECHGLAAVGDELFLITTGDLGMAIWGVRPSDWSSRVVKPASRVTISDLVGSNDNRLYFGSIASGYDEIHSIDLLSGEESRITTSRYGSFYGAPSADGAQLALAVYDQRGYHLATAPIVTGEVVENRTLPANVVNPNVFRWEDVVCVDTIRYGAREMLDMRDNYPSEPFSRAKNALNIHSWAPVYYRPEQLMGGNLGELKFGATVVSQSLLSDAVSSLGVYVLPSGNVGTNLNVKYLGWAPKLEFNARLSTSPAGIYEPKGIYMKEGDYYASYDHTEEVERPAVATASWSMYGRMYLPIILSHSWITTVLTPSVELSHANNVLYSPLTGNYHKGHTAVGATLQWNSYTRTAYRNLNPRWGLALIGGIGRSLVGFETPITWALFARAYTPALGANDGFTLKASWQDIAGEGPLNYALDFGWLQPRGVRSTIYPDDVIGGSVQYDTPLCYPDWGVKGLVSIKRLRLGLFVDTLWGRVPTAEGEPRRWDDATTFGADLWIDTSWLRLPEQGDVTFRVGCYFDRKVLLKPTFTGGIALNL